MTGCPRDKRGGWCGWTGVKERRSGWGAGRKCWSDTAGTDRTGPVPKKDFGFWSGSPEATVGCGQGSDMILN